MRPAMLAAALLAIGSVWSAAPVQAQAPAAFPTRPVTIVVPFPPGGGTDTGTRLLATKLSQKWAQPVLVENKAGAAGIVGAEYVAKAKPDGYTLLMGNIGTQSINPSLYKKLPYNADAAFVPVSLVAELPLVLVVHPNVPAQSAGELIALARSRKPQLSYSSSGPGGSMHLAGALFERAGQVDMLHVPYKGGGPAITDLIGGHVDLSFATVLETSGHIKAGKLRPIAVTSERRSPALPDVPTLAESALPGYQSVSWIGLVAPAGTPQPVVDRIAADVSDVLSAAELRQQLVAQGATPVGSTPAQFKALIDADRQRYARIIQDQGISAD